MNFNQFLISVKRVSMSDIDYAKVIQCKLNRGTSLELISKITGKTVQWLKEKLELLNE